MLDVPFARLSTQRLAGEARIDRAFLDVLGRPPTPLERRLHAGWPTSALLRRLCWSAEFRRGVAPFVRDARRALAAVGATGVDVEDLWHLHDRWRRTLVHRHPRWGGHVEIGAESVARARACVRATIASVLEREPDEITLRRCTAALVLGLVDPRELRAEFEACVEAESLRRFHGALDAATAALARVDPRAGSVADEERRALLERWRAHGGFDDASGTRGGGDDTQAFASAAAEACRLVDDVFGRTLHRPPDARDARQFALALVLGLVDATSLRAELERTAEYARLQRFLRVARDSVFDAIDGTQASGANAADGSDRSNGEHVEGGEHGDEAFVRDLVERWRARGQPPIVGEDQDDAHAVAAVAAARTRARERIDGLFRDVLRREPDDATARRFALPLSLGLVGESALRASVEDSAEARRVSRFLSSARRALRGPRRTQHLASDEEDAFLRDAFERWRAAGEPDVPFDVDAPANATRAPEIVLASAERDVEALFQNVLERAPDAVTSCTYTARLALGLVGIDALRAEVESLDAARRLRRFRAAVRSALATTGSTPGARPADDDAFVRDQTARWRALGEPAFPGERDEESPDESAFAHALERARREVDTLFQDILSRPPDPVTASRCVARLVLGLVEPASVRAEIESTEEAARLARVRRTACVAVTGSESPSEPCAAERAFLDELVARWRAAGEPVVSAIAVDGAEAPTRRIELVGEAHRVVAEIFRDVLSRSPDELTQRRYAALLVLGLADADALRAELRESAEGRRLERFQRAARTTLRALAADEGSTFTDEERDRLVERWRAAGGPEPVLGRGVADATDARTTRAATRVVDATFEQVLARSPDAPARRCFAAAVLLGLADESSLRLELERSHEHARLARVRRAASEVLRRIAPEEDGDVLDADARAVVERWRALGEPEVDASVFGDVDAASSTGIVAREIDEVFRQVLLRPPDAATHRRTLARIRLGLDRIGSLRTELARSDEHVRIVRPLVRTIHDAYREFVHRPPTASEVQDAVDRARTELRTHDELVDALADGTIRRVLGIRPLKLEMDVTSQCNLRCTMCYLSDPRFGRRPRVDVSVDSFREIARQVFPHCGLVSLSFGTEPLLHPRIEELLEITAREGVPWRYLITNAQLLDERRIETFVRVPLHGFSISVDASTRTTYERIRRGASWDRLIANVRALQAAKRRAGSVFPRITFNFVLMRSNLEELPGLVELAHELGVEGVAAMHVTPFEGLDTADERLDGEPERCNAVLARTRAVAERLGVPVALPESFDVADAAPAVLKDATPVGFLFPEPTAPTTGCPFPWQFVGIDPYGNVVPCGHWYTRPPMGDVHTQSFAEIWNGARWRELRREHAGGDLASDCRHCPAAGMGSCDNPDSFGTVRLGAPPRTDELVPRERPHGANAHSTSNGAHVAAEREARGDGHGAQRDRT